MKGCGTLAAAVLVAVGLGIGPIAEAGVYRWVDEQGRVQFSDRPPVEQEAEQVDVKLPESPSGNSGQSPSMEQRRLEQQKMLDAYREERELKKERRRQDAAKRAEKKRQCHEARDRLRMYEQSRLYRLQQDGSRRFLNDEQYEQTLKETRQAVKRLCGG